MGARRLEVLDDERALAGEDFDHLFQPRARAALLVDFGRGTDERAQTLFAPTLVNRDGEPRGEPAEEVAGRQLRVNVEVAPNVRDADIEISEEDLEQRQETVEADTA